MKYKVVKYDMNYLTKAVQIFGKDEIDGQPITAVFALYYSYNFLLQKWIRYNKLAIWLVERAHFALPFLFPIGTYCFLNSLEHNTTDNELSDYIGK